MATRTKRDPNAKLADAATQVRNWTATRKELIAKARADGQSLRAIALVTGLSHTAVSKIAELSGEG